MATKIVPEEILEILKRMECDGDEARITDGQLPRKTYVQLNKVLDAVGGSWNRKKNAHVFPAPAAEMLADVIATGMYESVNWRTQFQIFETPPEIAEQMCEIAEIGKLKKNAKVLEPSAGGGAIVDVIQRINPKLVVRCVELRPEAVEVLMSKPKVQCCCADFLCIKPGDHCASNDPDATLSKLGENEVILMNSPFTRSQDIQHVLHAYQFLKTGGVLVAIMSVGFTFRQDWQAKKFRDWLEEVDGEYHELPKGSFRTSGTMVNTVMVTVRK